MSIHTTPVLPDGLDNRTGGRAGSHAPVGFHRLVRVEARKLCDTRAGRWLIVGMLAAVLAVAGGYAALASFTVASWTELTSMAMFPVTLLLPVLAILTMTSEWTQRTALVTYTMEPRRGRVLAAKLTVLAGLTLLATAVMVPIGAAATLIAGNVSVVPFAWDLGLADLAGLAGVLGLQVAFGAALGLLLMNSTAAIVTLFLLPTVLGVGSALSTRAAEVISWIELNQVSAVLVGGPVTGEALARLAVGTTVMVLVPGAIGIVANLRREIS